MADSVEAKGSGAPTPERRTAWLALPLLFAAAVTVGLYVFGTQHAPAYYTSLFGRSGPDTLSLKSWLGTALLALAGIQLLLALSIYGRIPGLDPRRWFAHGHRAVGVTAFLLSLPIAYHCAFAYGVQTNVDTRVAVHSLAGCFFYGAFAAKVTIVRSRRLPGWTLPVVGGLLVTLVAVLWYTSALWYFHNYSLPSL